LHLLASLHLLAFLTHVLFFVCTAGTLASDRLHPPVATIDETAKRKIAAMIRRVELDPELELEARIGQQRSGRFGPGIFITDRRSMSATNGSGAIIDTGTRLHERR
jgi:hypothetical protein